MFNDGAVKLNNTDYEFEVTLSNADGSVIVPKAMFKELKIDERFTDWPFRGYIIYDNSQEKFERLKTNKKISKSEPFYFRRDGTDVIDIHIKPVLKKLGKKSPTQMFDEDEHNLATLIVKGAVYDTEDLSNNDINTKLKKIYFHDYNYQKALGLNTRVSCGEYLTKYVEDKPPNLIGSSNGSRMVDNGELLKYICEHKLGADTGAWDFGTKKSFYISPPSMCVDDDMRNLMNGYVSDKKYPGYFYYNRLTNKFELISYKTLFDRYMTVDRERLEFTDPTDIKVGVHPPRFDNIKSWFLEATSKIIKYKYSKMSPMSNTKSIVSRIASGYNGESGQFLRSAENGYIEAIEKNYKELLGEFPVGIRKPLMVVNSDKLDNKNSIEYHVLEATSISSKTIRSSIIYNDAIQFSALGFVSRRPGIFIDITSQSDTEGIWEDVFLGSWLVMGVTHHIKDTIYTNDILAVKPNTSFEYPVDVDGLHKGVS